MRVMTIAALALLMSACARQDAPLSGEALVQRGEYLVTGVVLCGDCHTPRLQDMSLDATRTMHGAPVFPPGPPEVFAPFAPAIAGGPANYTEEQFIAFLQTGVRPDGTHPRPPMPPYRLTEEDARAVNAYIRSLAPAPAE